MSSREEIDEELRRIDDENARREREASGALTDEDVDAIADKIRNGD